MNLLKKLKNLAGVVDHVVQDLAVVADVVQLAAVDDLVQEQAAGDRLLFFLAQPQ